MRNKTAITILENIEYYLITHTNESCEQEHAAIALAIKALEETDAKRQGEWIPVSERLPENDNYVLVYDNVDMFVAWFSETGWHSSDSKFVLYTPIIAWQPLPKPYELKKGGAE